MATAIALYGPGSGAALATVVGVLVEVPVMLSVCRFCVATRGWFHEGPALGAGESGLTEPPMGLATATPADPAPADTARGRALRQGLLLLLVGAAWWLVYSRLAAAASWLTFEALGLVRRTALGSAVEFFLYEAPKVLMLLTLVVFGVGIVRSFFTPERTRRVLAGKREGVGSSSPRSWAS